MAKLARPGHLQCAAAPAVSLYVQLDLDQNCHDVDDQSDHDHDPGDNDIENVYLLKIF